MNQRSRSLGFTVVELLVCIALLGVLAAVLFVGIGRVRERAAQTQCENNLKQIALASLHYEDAFGVFPPGVNKQTQAGVLMYLLPYVDQQNLYAQLPGTLPTGKGDKWWLQVPGLTAESPVAVRVPTYECSAASLYAAATTNGTVQSEAFRGGQGMLTQLTLKQMLESQNPAIQQQGQTLANDLNQIYYAAWAAQSLVFTWDRWGATDAAITLNLDGGSVQVVGGTAGQYFWNGSGENFTDGAEWSAVGAITINGVKYDINFQEPNLFLNMIGGAVYDSSNDIKARNYLNSGYASYDGNVNNELALLAGNRSGVGNYTANFSIPVATDVRPQDNPLFWAYYNATYSVTHTFAVAGSSRPFSFVPNSPADRLMGLTSYVGNAGMFSFNDDAVVSGNGSYSNGPYFPDSTTTAASIVDGTSNTIAFGEALGGSELGPRDYALTWMSTGVMPSYWDCQSPAAWYTFGSVHVGGVNFAFCDGSVRRISKVPASPTDATSAVPAQIGTPRWIVFQQLAGIQDKMVPDLSILD